MNRTTIFILLIFLSSCIRPHYTPQLVNTPEQWRFETDEGDTLCNVKWWEQFNDPILNTFILTALRNNQDLQVAIARVQEYYARYGISNSFLYPTINSNAMYTRTKNSIALTTTPEPIVGVGIGIPRIFNDFQAFLSLNWELDFWGRLSGASEATYYDMLGQVEARRAIVITVVTSVANAYIRLRQLDSQLEVSKKTLESRLESLKLAIFRFRLGETSEIEVKQAESEVEIAAIRKTEFERDIPIAENLLSILLGENPHSIERGSTIESLQIPLEIPAGLPSDLLTRRPDIVQAEDNLIAANARVTAARALLYPQFNLTGFFGHESNRLPNLFTSPSEMWQYTLAAVEPLFNAGRTKYEIQATVAFRAELLFQYRQTILNAFREVNDALISYQKNRELVREHEKQVKVLSDYLHLAQLRYLEGEIDYLNVLDAERSLFNAELELVQSQADSFSAVIQLYSALGGGWVLDADSIAISKDPC